jgi:hypothetical protein
MALAQHSDNAMAAPDMKRETVLVIFIAPF